MVFFCFLIRSNARFISSLCERKRNSIKFVLKKNHISVKIMDHVQMRSAEIRDYCSLVIKGKKVLSAAPGDPFKYRKLNEFVSMIFKLSCLAPAGEGIKWSDK